MPTSNLSLHGSERLAPRILTYAGTTGQAALPSQLAALDTLRKTAQTAQPSNPGTGMWGVPRIPVSCSPADPPRPDSLATSGAVDSTVGEVRRIS